MIRNHVARATLILTLLTGSIVIAGAAASPADAADFTWNGGGPDALWTDVSNWSGAAPSGSVGTLTFPLLTSGACTALPVSASCYTSVDDVSGLTADALSIDDTEPYLLTGVGFGLGAGGLTAGPDATATGLELAYIDLPVTLTAPQTWSVTGDANASELAIQSVTGTAEPLTINFADQARLGFGAGNSNDSEIGPVTASGSGAVVVVGSLNATDGNPLTLEDGAGLVATAAGAQVGPVTVTGGYVRVGHGEAPDDGTLAVDGSLSLDAASRAVFSIDQPGTAPGTDFTQLTASGNIALGGATLDLYQGIVTPSLTCAILPAGSAYTLASATGTLTGTFAGVPNGSTVPLSTPCGTTTGLSPTATITYSANAVTATIDPYATTTVLTTTPTSLFTNEPVTLTATISAGAAVPSGTVTFDDDGSPIPGCTDESVSSTGSSYTATCTTTFSPASSPASLTAAFTPAAGSGVTASTSAAASLAIGRAVTTTVVSVSSDTAAIGSPVTYAAAVTADRAGSAVPSGTVAFYDDGHAVPSCSASVLVAGVASCTVTYAATGSHDIQAVYAGDTNFSGSTSLAGETVTVTGAADHGAGSPVLSSPVAGHSAVVRGVTGTVLIRLPHSTRFIVLRPGESVPVGSTLNATHGTIALTFARPTGSKASARRLKGPAATHGQSAHRATATMWALFSQGEFIIIQTRAGMVIAVLAGGNFSSCRKRPRGVLATTAAAKPVRKPIRKLWVHDHGGSFGTRGAYVATAVVGTQWLTEDFCTGSEVQVTRGTVRVTSSITHRSRLVHAHHGYFVKA